MKVRVTNCCTFFCILFINIFVHLRAREKYLFEDPKRLFGISERITFLKTYAPSEDYCWDLEWKVGKHIYSGMLTGKTEGIHHWIDIKFPDNTSLFFDKNNTQQAFYPNRLCVLTQDHWGESLGGLPAVSYELIAMPFLDAVVASVKKTAKQGRKALEIDFTYNRYSYTKTYLDLKFNTILEVQLLSVNSVSKFKLKSLKKFNGVWGLHQAEFSKDKTITKLTVKMIKSYR